MNFTYCPFDLGNNCEGVQKSWELKPQNELSTVLYSYVMCMCDMAQSPTCSLCCSKKEQMRLNQRQSDGRRRWKRRYLHIYCLLAPLRITEASTNKPAVLQLSSHLCSTTLRGSPDNPRDTCTANLLKVGTINPSGFHWISSNMSNGQWMPSRWDRYAGWDLQVINDLILLSHICCND